MQTYELYPYRVHFKLSHPVIARHEAIQYTTLTLDCFDNKLSRNDGKVVKRQFEMHPHIRDHSQYRINPPIRKHQFLGIHRYTNSRKK